jgi:hypothetical protein
VLLGNTEGSEVGGTLGKTLGGALGEELGFLLGILLGILLGSEVGTTLGVELGAALGHSVQIAMIFTSSTPYFVSKPTVRRPVLLYQLGGITSVTRFLSGPSPEIVNQMSSK